MTVDKKKLFNIMKKGGTEICLTYRTEDFELNNRDVTFNFGNLEYRSFESGDRFQLISYTTEEDIEQITTGFQALKDELIKIKCLTSLP